MIRNGMVRAVGLAGLFLGLAASSASAGSMLGTQATFELAYPEVYDIEEFWGPFTVVNTGPELTVNGEPGLTGFVLTVTGDSLTISFPEGGVPYGGDFNGYILVDDQVTFESVSIDPSTTLTAFDASRLSFDAHDIYGNGTGIGPPAGSSVTLDISSVPVPEPSAMILMTTGAITAILFCGSLVLRR